MLSCTAPEQNDKSSEYPGEHTNQYPAILQKVFDAHGGLSQWQKMKSASFDLYYNGKEVDEHKVDLNSRKTLVFNDVYRLGYDGDQVWYTGQDEEEFPGGSSRFYHNLHFYFFAMPFVFADDGIVYEELGVRIIRDQAYDVLKVSFKEGVGDAPEDEYVLYFDQQSHRLSWMLYTVTYFSQQESDKYSARHYKNWQWVNGLLVPLDCDKYRWNKDSLHEQQYSNSYRNVELSELVIDQSMFLAPANAQKSP